jgi:hypothetical protein
VNGLFNVTAFRAPAGSIVDARCAMRKGKTAEDLEIASHRIDGASAAEGAPGSDEGGVESGA